jgi:hypothetical protein
MMKFHSYFYITIVKKCLTLYFYPSKSNGMEAERPGFCSGFDSYSLCEIQGHDLPQLLTSEMRGLLGESL